MSGIKFSVSYQFEQSRLGTEIFWQISKDFNVASWMEKYFAGFNKDTDNQFTIDVVDIRQLKSPQKQGGGRNGPWTFLEQDQNEDSRLSASLQ
jgi:hypothetical protein